MNAFHAQLEDIGIKANAYYNVLINFMEMIMILPVNNAVRPAITVQDHHLLNVQAAVIIYSYKTCNVFNLVLVLSLQILQVVAVYLAIQTVLLVQEYFQANVHLVQIYYIYLLVTVLKIVQQIISKV